MENANAYHTEGSNHEKKGRDSSVNTEEKSNYSNWRDWRDVPSHNTEKSSSSTRLPLSGRDDRLNTLGFEPTRGGDLYCRSCRLCHREKCGNGICLSSPTNYITNSSVEATARSKPKTERDVGGTKHSARKCRYKNDVLVDKMELPHQVGNNIEATVRVTDHSGLLSISDLQLSIGFHEGSRDKPHTRYNTGDTTGTNVQQNAAHDPPISSAKRECCKMDPSQNITVPKLSNFKGNLSPRLSTDADCTDGNGKRDSVKCVHVEHEVLVGDSKHKSQSSGIGMEKYDDEDDDDVRNLLHRSLELQTYIRIRQEETYSYNKGQHLTHQKSGTHSLISKEEKHPNSRHQKSTDHSKGHSNLPFASNLKAGHDLVIENHGPLSQGTEFDLSGGGYRSQSVGGSLDLRNEFRSLPQTHSSKSLLQLSVHSTAPGSEENQLLSNGNDPILSRHNQVLSDWKDPMHFRNNHSLSIGKEPLLIRDNRVLSNEKDHTTSSGRSSSFMQRKESVFPPRKSDKLSQSRSISQSSNSSCNMDRGSLTSLLASKSRETALNTGPPSVRSQGSRVGREDTDMPCANGGLTDSIGSERPEGQLNMSYGGSEFGSLNLTLPQPEELPVLIGTEQGFPKVPSMPVSIPDNADISSVISQDCQDSQDFSLRTEMLISHLKLANEILDEFAAETKALVNLTRGAHVLDDSEQEKFKSGLVADKEVMPGCEIGNMDRVSAWLNEGLKKRDQTLPSRTSPPSSPNVSYF